MQYIQLNELRNNLDNILEHISQCHEPVEVEYAATKAVILIDSQDYHSLMETLYLSQSKANAEYLHQSIEQHRLGQVREIDVTAYLD